MAHFDRTETGKARDKGVNMQEPGVLDDTGAQYVQSLGPWGQRLHAFTRWFAIAGGVGFIALVTMSLVSIIGRKIAATPVPGDIEIVQMGTAIASAAMLAFCEMDRQHLRVDFFTAKLSAKIRHVLDALSHLILAVVALVIAWRTGLSALSLNEAGETSVILGWPVWAVVAGLVPSFLLLSIAGLYNTVHSMSSAVVEDVV
jgi:TRAP-type C4-dicarboxylate transport system permease small subunit